MFEKIKNSGKLPLIIGIAVAAIIIIVMAIIIGININKSREANADTKLSDSANQKEIVDSAEETDEPIVIIDEVVEEEETTEEEPEQKEEKVEQNTNIKYFIRVNYGQNVVNIYTKDENGEYTVPYKAMLCSTGKATPRSGTYTMPSGTYSRGTWGLMVGNVWAQYFTRIKGSILFHSVPYTERNKWSLEYWEYDKLGTAASAGCVRLTVENAKWIYNNCPSGTKVEFYTDSNPGPFGKPSEQKISEHEEVRGWDPEDPDPNNPWKTYTPKQEDITTLPSDTGITPPEEIPTTPITPAEPDTSTGNETENPSEDKDSEEETEISGESEDTDGGTKIPEDNNASDEENGTTDASESSDGKIEKPSEDESSEESSDEQVQTSIEG